MKAEQHGAVGVYDLPEVVVRDREKQQIAAVSHAAGNLDLFVIGFEARRARRGALRGRFALREDSVRSSIAIA